MRHLFTLSVIQVRPLLVSSSGHVASNPASAHKEMKTPHFLFDQSFLTHRTGLTTGVYSYSFHSLFYAPPTNHDAHGAHSDNHS